MSGSGLWIGLGCFVFLLQVIEDFLDDHRVFDTGDDFHGAAARLADLDVDVEYPLEALRPRHGCSPFNRRLWFIGYPASFYPYPTLTSSPMHGICC